MAPFTAKGATFALPGQYSGWASSNSQFAVQIVVGQLAVQAGQNAFPFHPVINYPQGGPSQLVQRQFTDGPALDGEVLARAAGQHNRFSQKYY